MGRNWLFSFVISKWLLSESLVFRTLVKGNEDSGNEIVASGKHDMFAHGLRHSGISNAVLVSSVYNPARATKRCAKYHAGAN